MAPKLAPLVDNTVNMVPFTNCVDDIVLLRETVLFNDARVICPDKYKKQTDLTSRRSRPKRFGFCAYLRKSH